MIIQPGSLDAEAGIFASTFDRTGLRLITCNADKTIHIYGQDEEAVCPLKLERANVLDGGDSSYGLEADAKKKEVLIPGIVK